MERRKRDETSHEVTLNSVPGMGVMGTGCGKRMGSNTLEHQIKRRGLGEAAKAERVKNYCMIPVTVGEHVIRGKVTIIQRPVFDP